MATKKTSSANRGPRSKKRTGHITQSIRIPVSDNKLLHRAAKEDGRSFNGWAINVLMREANKILKPKVKTEATVG